MSKIILEQTASTQDDARRLALEGAAHGTALIAKRQTGGRGRMGRAFHSPEGGLYMSVVLKPEALRLNTPTAVTAFTGLCVCEAVKNIFNIDAGIKWVNDITVNEKKVCGILVEALANSVGVFAYVAGIGVNVYTKPEDFPEEIKDRAASLMTYGEDGPVMLNELADEILIQILNGETDELFTRYKKKLTVLGKRVTVTRGSEVFNATALDIDGQGRLIIRRDNGTREALLYGEVTQTYLSKAEPMPS